MAKATFGAGCFWGVEETFRTLAGVKATAVGYAGGHVEQPTYEQVCTDTTGHVEVVEVQYDASQVSYEKLLDVFFNCHNPTQVNRQGPDYGQQYRTVVFYHDEAQKLAAESAKAKLAASGKYSQNIATSIEPAAKFWPAEEYHQQYLHKRGQTSCGL
jgi:peptide-methionine (S)-S-oxide reductase